MIVLLVTVSHSQSLKEISSISLGDGGGRRLKNNFPPFKKSSSDSDFGANLMLIPLLTESHELPMHESVSSTLKKALSTRLQPVSCEIINLFALLFTDDDDDDAVDVLAVGIFVLELELIENRIKKINSISNVMYNLNGISIEQTYEVLLSEKTRTVPSLQHVATFVLLEFHSIRFTSAV